MAKPILIVKTSLNLDYINDLKKGLAEYMPDYHVLVHHSYEYKQDTFECLNDCKGLKDVDIEKLIEDLKNGKA